MPDKKLFNLYCKFESRTNFIVNKFEDKPSILKDYGDTFSQMHFDARAMELIRLQTLWGQMCRELILISACGCYTISGNLLVKASNAKNWTAINTAIQKLSRNYFPPWHYANFIIKLAKYLGIQNYNQLSLALGGISPMDNIISIRNYIVHPDQITKQKYIGTLQSMHIVGLVEPITLMTSRTRGGATLFEEWVLDLQNIAVTAMQ